jgi:hypothetical protein
MFNGVMLGGGGGGGGGVHFHVANPFLNSQISMVSLVFHIRFFFLWFGHCC